MSTPAELWIQYAHLAEGGFGRVMWEADFMELMKRLETEHARELADIDQALKAVLGEWPMYLQHTEEDGTPANDKLTRAGAIILCLQKREE